MKSIEQILMDKIKEELLAGSKEEINDLIMFLVNENKELVGKLAIAVEALQRYANGQALKVKPEKIHLYIDDICHGNPLWHQRSMSDYDDRLLAKEALEKLRGENELY